GRDAWIGKGILQDGRTRQLCVGCRVKQRQARHRKAHSGEYLRIHEDSTLRFATPKRNDRAPLPSICLLTPCGHGRSIHSARRGLHQGHSPLDISPALCRVKPTGADPRIPRLPHAGVVMHSTHWRCLVVRQVSHPKALWQNGLVVALVAVLARGATAQRTTLSGVVRDSSGAPIPEADVSIASAHLLTRTSNSGAFLLSRVEIGQAELSVRRLGYTPRTLQVDLRTSGNDTLVIVLA